MKKFWRIFLLILFIIPLSKYLFPQDKAVIPNEIKSILAHGIESLEVLSDIPFYFTKHLYLPAQKKVHSVFLFNFAAEKSPSFDNLTRKGYANLHIFIQFYQLEYGNPPRLYKNVYIPMKYQNKEDEKTNFYSIGYPLPPGKYISAIAITSEDLEIIGTQFFEFLLPDFSKLKFDITPIFFVDNIERIPSPETICEVHRGYFTYSVLRIVPKLNNLFSPPDNMDVFYYVYGTNSKSFMVDYNIYRDNELVVNFASKSFSQPIVSQPLPLLEKHNLSSGFYIFSMVITDLSTGRKITKITDIEIR